jgi:spermidine synthase
MNLKFSRWDKIRSYLISKVVDSTQSAQNPYLEVSLSRGRLVLNTAMANYSFGGLHRVFQVAFRKIGMVHRPVKNILLLGMGGGSVPAILYDELKMDVNITAVEKDEVVIDLARKYFNTGRFEKMKIVCADAYDYLQHSTEEFDAIIVDVYSDISVPEKFETLEFVTLLHDHLTKNGLMLFNKVAATQKLYKQYRLLKEKVQGVFAYMVSVRAMGFNRVIVASKNIF